MKKRIFAFLIASAVTLSFTGCDLSDIESFMNDSSKESSEKSSDESSSSTDFSDMYSPVSIDDVVKHAEEILKDAEVSGNTEKLEEDIDILLNDLDMASEALSYITLDYYCDWYNEELEAEYDSCYETYWLSYELLSYAFSNCYVVEEYSTLFEPYIYSDESVEYYTTKGLSIERLMGYSRVDYELMDEYLDEYYSIAYNSSTNDKFKNNASAEVYIDILSSYDTESFYENYNRDFTADEIIALSQVIQEVLIPVMNSIEESLEDIPYYDDVYDNPVEFDNTFETISEYADRISPTIGARAKDLVSNKEYKIASGDNSYNGSFTVDLPVKNGALIYTYQYGDYYDLVTAIHEFGHYYAAMFDNHPTYLRENNIDVAEIQSQGMEILFMTRYDELYGNQADAIRMLKLYDMLDSVISGFLIGEFEYTVLNNLEDMTAEDIVEYYDTIMKDYAPNSNFYYISHLFEQPGYYISYGVSALAAFDIWETSLADSSAAIEMYENIAHISNYMDSYQFKSALECCEFDNVLTEEYIRKLASELQTYADNIIK